MTIISAIIVGGVSLSPGYPLLPPRLHSPLSIGASSQLPGEMALAKGTMKVPVVMRPCPRSHWRCQ